MSHVAFFVSVRSPAAESGRAAAARLGISAAAELDAPPSWTPARIDLARRLWSKGVDDAEIVIAITRLPGANDLNAQAVADLAQRLRWPGPKQARLGGLPATRDGSPSIAERQAAELAAALDWVELPMEDAVAWGKANGVVRSVTEPDPALLQRINRARAGFGLPRFRITRHEPAVPMFARKAARTANMRRA